MASLDVDVATTHRARAIDRHIRRVDRDRRSTRALKDTGRVRRASRGAPTWFFDLRERVRLFEFIILRDANTPQARVRARDGRFRRG